MKTYKRLVRILVFGFLCLVAATGCGRSESNNSEVQARPEKIVPVEVELVVPVNLTEEFTLPAGLEAWEDLVIAAEISGTVQQLHFSEGDSVKYGDILLEIDPETIKSYLARDQENVGIVRRKLERYRQLEKDGLVSRQELDELENSLVAAETALRATQLQLAKSAPRAPTRGIVDRLYIDRGEYVEPGKELARLVQVDRLKAIAEVPEKDVHFLRTGQQVEIIPASMNQGAHSIAGIIEHIAYAANDITRTYRTKIVIDNHTGELRPGMIVRARFVRQNLKDVIAAPLYAVMDRDGEKIVFVVDNGQARQLKVRTGSSVGQHIVIEDGLAAGQKLIVKGQQLLIDGARVAEGGL